MRAAPWHSSRKIIRMPSGIFRRGRILWEENVANYLLALAYLDAGMPDKAIDRFKENLITVWSRLARYRGILECQKCITTWGKRMNRRDDGQCIDEYQTFSISGKTPTPESPSSIAPKRA